jgi:xylan 1,4-beta-xylosidase
MIPIFLAALTSQTPSLTIDCQKTPIPRSDLYRFSVGSDRAKIFLRNEHQRDLSTLAKSVEFRYLRCHGIFNEEMDIIQRDEAGKITYNWKNVDAFIEQLRRVKIKPFVELGFIPEAIASGKKTIFYWKGNVTPPAQQKDWGDLVAAFAKHCITKYGLAEVRSWYFEVWNEPNLDGFWTGGQDGYFELYKTSAFALKAVDTKLRVGGPSTAGMGWIPEFLDYCAKNSVPVDFVSSHSYGTTEGFLDEKGRSHTTLSPNPNSLHGEFVAARANIKKSKFPNLPLFITEWGPSYSPRDPIHDSYICAPYILEKIRLNEGVVDGLSYWAFSDQFEEPGPPGRPFHGGFGLMNVDGLKKPAFHAYDFLGQLGPKEIKTDYSRAIVTPSRSGYIVLVWDYTAQKQDAPDDPFYHRDLPATPLPELVIRLTHAKPGTYKVTRQGVGYKRADLYGAYLDAGKPVDNKANLNSTNLKKLTEASTVKAESLPNLVVDAEGNGELRVPMRTNDVWLIKISG